MANKFTTKEILNKVLLDSSGNAVTANSVTTQEALNAALDTSNNRLNMSLAGGSISGDVTISGDLTVVGSATNTYDEQIQGIVQIVGSTGTGATPAGTLQLTTAETTVVDDDQLGRIEFLAASEADGSDSQLVGASIAGEAEATFAADNNSTALVFSTNTSAAATERMRIDSLGNMGLGVVPDTTWLSTRTALQIGGSGCIFGRTSTGADGDLSIGENVYQHSGGSYRSISEDEATLYRQSAGVHEFKVTASVADNATISFTDVAKFDINSRISLSNNGGEATNTIFGYQAGNSIHSSSGMNTFIGHQVADATMTADADENTAIGHLALSSLTSGEMNTVMGSYAGINITAGDKNVLIGRSAGNNHNSSNLVAIGTSALASISDAAADGSVAIGYNSLTALTSGASNTAVGLGSMDVLTTGSNNTGLGDRSLSATDDGANNTAVGAFAMESGNCGDNNTAVGADSLKACTGSGNIAIGYDSGDVITTGTNNVIIGSGADPSANNGTNQIVLGQGTTGVGDNTVTLGNNDVTAVNMSQDKGATVNAGGLVIGTMGTDNDGLEMFAGASDGGLISISTDDEADTNRIRFYNGNGLVGTIKTNGSATSFNTSSDYRLKENEVLISDGLTRLNKLKPYRFNFKADSSKTVDGFFAHEVSDIVPEAVTGAKDAVDNEGNIESQGIDQSKLVPLLVKAVQELTAKVEELESKL